MTFQEAVRAADGFVRRPSAADRLQLEALYQQATEGDIRGRRPGFTDFAGRMRYDARARLAGMPCAAAETAYADLVRRLLEKHD